MRLFDIEKEVDDALPFEVQEQCVSNLLQSAAVGDCVAAMPVLKMIPTSILWGSTSPSWPSKASMETSSGKGFSSSSLLQANDTKCLKGVMPPMCRRVPSDTITRFTLLQMVYLLLCLGATWISVAGVLFPLMVVLLVHARQYILPKLFDGVHLACLDAAEYEESPALPYNAVTVSSLIYVRLMTKFDFSPGPVRNILMSRTKYKMMSFFKKIHWK